MGIKPTKVIRIKPGSELAEMVDATASANVVLEKDGVRYRLMREDEWDDLFAGYDPEAALAGMLVGAGSWSDIDAEKLKADIYRWRDEGSR